MGTNLEREGLRSNNNGRVNISTLIVRPGIGQCYLDYLPHRDIRILAFPPGSMFISEESKQIYTTMTAIISFFEETDAVTHPPAANLAVSACMPYEVAFWQAQNLGAVWRRENYPEPHGVKSFWSIVNDEIPMTLSLRFVMNMIMKANNLSAIIPSRFRED